MLNIDGSSGAFDNNGYGGLFRDNKVDWIVDFSFNEG